MKPITREEQYLNRLTGEEGIIPDKPVTREEQYFARLCGGDNVIPDKPVTRREQYLATLCGEDVITPTKPVTRIEQYMAFASGESESKPEKPITREEMYWDKYQGGDVPEEKTIAFTDIITVTDALARPAVDLQSEITATQNLNGYEYPWVGGAGVNKFAIGDAVAVPSSYAYGLTVSIDANAETIRIHGTAGWSTSGAKSFRILSTKENGTYGDAPVTHDYTGKIFTPFVVNKSSNITSVDRVMYNATEGTLIIIANSTADKETDITLHIAITEDTAPSAWTPYENICPISGRTEVNVTRTGKNTCPLTTMSPTPRVYWGTNWADLVTYINTLDIGTYAISLKYKTVSVTDATVNTGYPYIRAYINGSYTNITQYVITTDENPEVGKEYTKATSFTITSETKGKASVSYLYANGGTFEIEEFMIEVGSTATEYEPYEGDTFNTELGRTVYGGTLDLTTGELTVTHAIADLGGLRWLYSPSNDYFTVNISGKKKGQTNFITTNYRTVNKDVYNVANGEITGDIYDNSINVKDDRTADIEVYSDKIRKLMELNTGQKMVYELATPQTISLTPTEVMMLENNNTIWADSGRVQLTYLSKAAERVQLMNASLKANTLKISKGAIKE